jgi:hypothetical protein
MTYERYGPIFAPWSLTVFVPQQGLVTSLMSLVVFLPVRNRRHFKISNVYSDTICTIAVKVSIDSILNEVQTRVLRRVQYPSGSLSYILLPSSCFFHSRIPYNLSPTTYLLTGRKIEAEIGDFVCVLNTVGKATQRLVMNFSEPTGIL